MDSGHAAAALDCVSCVLPAQADERIIPGEARIVVTRQFLPGFTALLLCAFLLACGEDPVNDNHLDNARAYLEKSNTRAAIVELKSALRKNPQNGHARALLGKVYFDRGQYEDAQKELTRAYEAGVDMATVVPALAQVLLGLREYKKLELLSITGLEPPDRSVALAAKGLGKLEQGDMVTATEILEAATEHKPATPYAVAASARLLMDSGSYEKARMLLKLLLVEHPKYMPAWNLLGDIESAREQPKAAIQAYNNALKISPRTFDARLNRAMMFIYQKDFKKARKDLDYLQKTHRAVVGIHPGYHFARGIVLLRSKMLEPARKSFQKASEFSDAYPLSLYFLAVIDSHQGLVQHATIYAYNFLKLVPQSVVGKKLTAKLELQRGDYLAAERLMRQLITKRPGDAEVINLLAIALLAQGKSSQGIQMLGRVANLQPTSLEAKAQLGTGLLTLGNEVRGVEALTSVLEVNPGYEQADALIVLTYLREGRPNKAVQAAKGYRDRNPDSPTSYNLLGRAYLGADDKENAKAAFVQVLALKPDDPAANNSLADFELEDKNYDAARQYYESVLEGYPDNMHTLMKVASSYALQGREREMFDSIEAALRADPKSMEPRLMKARYYIAQGQLRKASPLFDELDSQQSMHPDALVTRASFELAAGRYVDARRSLVWLMRQRPDVAQYHYMKSRVHAGLGHQKDLLRELSRTVELEPNHFYARITLARLALAGNNTRKFERELTKLLEVAPTNFDVMKLEASLAQRKGDSVHAGQLLESLYRQDPTINTVIALAAHRQSTGNIEGAVTLLESWLELHVDDVRAREKLADLYDLTGQLDRVVQQYRAILQDDEEHILALNNLAWSLLADDPESALEYARKAYLLSPGSSSVLDTLALAQMKSERLVEARRSMDRALALAPDSPDVRFHDIQIKVAEGARKSALDALASLLEDHPGFAQRAEAEELFRQLN